MCGSSAGGRPAATAPPAKPRLTQAEQRDAMTFEREGGLETSRQGQAYRKRNSPPVTPRNPAATGTKRFY